MVTVAGDHIPCDKGHQKVNRQVINGQGGAYTQGAVMALESQLLLGKSLRETEPLAECYRCLDS